MLKSCVCGIGSPKQSLYAWSASSDALYVVLAVLGRAFTDESPPEQSSYQADQNSQPGPYFPGKMVRRTIFTASNFGPPDQKYADQIFGDRSFAFADLYIKYATVW